MTRTPAKLISATPAGLSYWVKFFLVFPLVAAPLLARASKLHEAASHGDLAVVQKLLSSSPATVSITDPNGDTALHLAAAHGQLAVAKLLVASNAAVNATNRAGFTPLELAVSTRGPGAFSNILHADFEGLITGFSNVLASFKPAPAAIAPTDISAAWKTSLGAQESAEVVAVKRQIVELLLLHGATLTNVRGYSVSLDLSALNADGEELRALLKHGANPRQARQRGVQPIHFATLSGNRDGVTALIEAGADVNVPGIFGARPLFLACAGGDEPMVRVLLQAGANVELASNAGKRPLDVALEAGSEPIVALLLEKGASAKNPNNRNMTPLHVAAYNGSVKLMTLLLNKGAEIDAQDAEGFTPMLSAVERGHLPAADFLVSHGANPLAACNSDRRDALQIAASDNRLELMQWALDHGCKVDSRDREGRTALGLAALQGHPGAVALLLTNKSNPKAMSHRFDTALHQAAQGTFLNRHMASEAKTNASPKHPPPFGTPADYVATAALLLNNGAAMEAENADLATPLHLAAIGPAELVKFFLEQGAQPNARTLKGLTPLMIAASAGSAETAEALIAHGAQIDAVQTDGSNALLRTAADGNAPVLKVLLDHKCDFRSRNAHRATAVHLAAVGGHLQAAATLFDAGADVNASDAYGQTPLHIAVISRKPAMVEWLLAHGANLTLADRKGATPLDAAKDRGFFEIIQLLESRPPKRD